jgi:hypothetical protein
MTAQSFDHERLDVYRLSIDYVARSYEAAQPLEGLHRHRSRFRAGLCRNSDVLVRTKGIETQDDAAMKAMPHRIMAMLTRMAMKFDGVAEPSAGYDAEIDCDNEHRYATLSTSTSTSTRPRPQKRQSHGMQRNKNTKEFKPPKPHDL